MKILFLGANGIDTSKLQIAQEFRNIQTEIERARANHKIEFRVEHAVTPVDLNRLLLDYTPDIVHFSGHGTVLSVETSSQSDSTREFTLSDESFVYESSKQGAILLERGDGHSVHVSTKALARLFGILRTQRCVVLNACFSAAHFEAIAAHVDCVIGMKRAIDDQSAIVFAIGFYQAIARGQSVRTAFELGCSLIFTSGLAGADVPELTGCVDPETVRFTGTSIAQVQRGAFQVSDVQVIPNQDDGTCTLDFRVWNAGDADVLINRIMLRVIEISTSHCLGALEMSKEYEVDISSLVKAGDVMSCNVSQLVPSRSFDRFGIRINVMRDDNRRRRHWKLHTSLSTNVGMIEGQIVEFWLPFESESSYLARKTSEAKSVASLPECLVPYATAMKGPMTNVNPIREILERAHPEPIARSLILFEWFGRSGRHSAPELLLLEFPTPVLMDALANGKLTLTHIKGATEYFSGGRFTAKKLGDRNLLTDKIKEMMIEYAVAAGYDRGDRFAVECAIGKPIPQSLTKSSLSILQLNSSSSAVAHVTAPLLARPRIHQEIAAIQFEKNALRNPNDTLHHTLPDTERVAEPLIARPRIHQEVMAEWRERSALRNPNGTNRNIKWFVMGLLVAIIVGLLLVVASENGK